MLTYNNTKIVSSQRIQTVLLIYTVTLGTVSSSVPKVSHVSRLFHPCPQSFAENFLRSERDPREVRTLQHCCFSDQNVEEFEGYGLKYNIYSEAVL
jgi:hypothetical protein